MEESVYKKFSPPTRFPRRGRVANKALFLSLLSLSLSKEFTLLGYTPLKSTRICLLQDQNCIITMSPLLSSTVKRS